MKHTLLALVVVAAACLSACKSTKCCNAHAPASTVVDGKATVKLSKKH